MPVLVLPDVFFDRLDFRFYLRNFFLVRIDYRFWFMLQAVNLEF